MDGQRLSIHGQLQFPTFEVFRAICGGRGWLAPCVRDATHSVTMAPSTLEELIASTPHDAMCEETVVSVATEIAKKVQDGQARRHSVWLGPRRIIDVTRRQGSRATSKRHGGGSRSVLVWASLLLATLLIEGCSSSSDSTGKTCGAGTTDQGGVCVPHATGGAAGTAGSGGHTGSSGTMGTGGAPVGLHENDPCPGPEDNLLWQCKSTDMCPGVPEADCYPDKCDGFPYFTPTIGYTFIGSAPFNFMIRTSLAPLLKCEFICDPESCPDCVTDSHKTVNGNDLKLKMDNVSDQFSIVFKVDPPWYMTNDRDVNSTCDPHVQCLELPYSHFHFGDAEVGVATRDPQRAHEKRTCVYCGYEPS